MSERIGSPTDGVKSAFALTAVEVVL